MAKQKSKSILHLYKDRIWERAELSDSYGILPKKLCENYH
jgi:hypothetical protein